MSDLLIHRHGRTLQLTLNCPQTRGAPGNALSTQTTEALEVTTTDDSVDVCIISGNPRFFVAGTDPNKMAEKGLFVTLGDIHPWLWARISTFTKPFTVSVNDYTLGAGCKLTLLCDLIVADDNARFNLSETTLGITPSVGGIQRLVHSVGEALASQVVLSDENINARQAQRTELASNIYPTALADRYALELATTIARHSPLAFWMAKQSLRLSQEVSLQAGLQRGHQLFSLLSTTGDRCEDIDAFLQKRTPDLKGRQSQKLSFSAQWNRML